MDHVECNRNEGLENTKEKTITTTSTQKVSCLPRTLEWSQIAQYPDMLTKLEIDKAGHGAFAKAGVMVAVRLPTRMLIEEERKRIDSNTTMERAVAVMNTDTIGKINIFQATLEEAMTLFASANNVIFSMGPRRTHSSPQYQSKTKDVSSSGLQRPPRGPAATDHPRCHETRRGRMVHHPIMFW